MPLSEMFKGGKKNLFRILRYPPLTGDEPSDAVRAAAHGDINLITLLPAATTEGLQVKDSAGNWHAIKCAPSTIIINVADMLEECTAGWYRSTLHRVTNPIGENAKQERLSIPLFLHADPEVRLSERHTAKSYAQERYAELGLV